MLKHKAFFKTGLCILWLILGGISFPAWEIFANDVNKDTERIHLVLPGESLVKIAHQYFPLTTALTIGELIGEIREINGIRGSLIHPNQRIRIPLVQSNLVAAKTDRARSDFEARGIFINRFSMGSQKRRRILDGLIASGGNTVIFDGKDMRGELSYPSSVNLAKEIGADTGAIIKHPAKLFQYLHKKGLYVSVRLVLFYDPLLAAKRPELALRSMSTEKPWVENSRLPWVDPSLSAVQKYNLDIAKELAAMGVDEIQFDYIRFPTIENVRSAAYVAEKKEIPRHKIITGFLARAHKELAPYNVLLSIDVFGVIAWGHPKDIRMTGQKIEDLAKHTDVISPMIYPSHFNSPFQGIANPVDQPFLLVSETCRRFSSLLKGSKVTLRPWIQAFPFRVRNFNEKYILEQLRALAQSGAKGWLLWSAGNVYDVSWRALAQWNNMAMEERMVMAEPPLND
jgi:hypothetical protein